MQDSSPKKRRGVFVDVQNVFSTTRHFAPNARINYQALIEYFNESPDYQTTFTAFSSFDPEREEQRRFIMALALMGYRVITKPLKRLPSGEIKANMDMEIAMEILETARYLDEVVIVSGDGDFVALVNRLVLRGKIVRVVGPDQFSAPELIQACHEFVSLSRIPGMLEDA